MLPETKKLLEEFAKPLEWHSAGTPQDQERLLDFIVAAYRNGDRAIEQDEFLEILNECDEARNTEKTFALKKRSVSFKLYTFQKYEEGMRLLAKWEGR
jgi:hypothetical protein